MVIRTFVFAVVASATLGLGALAQQNQPQQPMGHGQMPMTMSADGLPEECRTAVQSGGQGQVMQGMDMQGMSMQGMSQSMQGMVANMTEAQKGYMEAMNKMHAPMMTGIMAKDPDVGFVCGMIVHHQGAIDMARVVQKTGDNAEAKRMAEKTIKEQGQEIAEMKDWLKGNAKEQGN